MSHEQPPAEPPPRATRRAPSLVLVHTGDGKGKSSSAFGTAMRAIARGWKVAVVQFLKSGDWSVGEEKVGRDLGIDWWSLGDGFTWDSADIDESEAIAREAWKKAKEIIEEGGYGLVVLDEVTYPINWKWLDIDDVIRTLQHRPEATSVILTGRDAPAELIELADTVTEMRKVKHAFDAGIMAKRGIDY